MDAKMGRSTHHRIDENVTPTVAQINNIFRRHAPPAQSIKPSDSNAIEVPYERPNFDKLIAEAVASLPKN